MTIKFKMEKDDAYHNFSRGVISGIVYSITKNHLLAFNWRECCRCCYELTFKCTQAERRQIVNDINKALHFWREKGSLEMYDYVDDHYVSFGDKFTGGQLY